MSKNFLSTANRVAKPEEHKKLNMEVKALVIYFDKEKKNKQIVRPNHTFDGNYAALASMVGAGKMLSWDTM